MALALREGEAFGLRWSDLDLKRGLIHIRQQIQPKRGGGFEFDDPKTSASVATLELTKNQVSMNIGERRRTIYVESIEEPGDDSIWQPDHEEAPIPDDPVWIHQVQPDP